MSRAAIVICAGILLAVSGWQLQPAFSRSESADGGASRAVQSFDEALNAHDSDAVFAMFAEEATVQQDRAPQTREQLQGWVDELIREDVRLDLVGEPWVSPRASSTDATAMTVTWRARLDLQLYRALGLQFVPASVRAVVVDRRITFLSIRPDPDWRSSAQLTALT